MTGQRCTITSRNPAIFADKKIVIFGGGDSALDWVLELYGKAKHISLGASPR